MLSPYNDPDYRIAKDWLKRNPQLCHYCGDRDANTLDHVPALMNHHHVRGAGCCKLVPACLTCNSSDGARQRNRAHKPDTHTEAW